MKVILSRKGFDSGCGGTASPILPNKTLLSLPIPANEGICYTDIAWQGVTYLDIIQQLNPKTLINKSSCCHLDPDLRQEVKPREHGWIPAFGQMGAPLTELRKQGVTIGDLFLFFGWFKQTEIRDGKLSYIRKAPGLHIIYGYMQIGGIIERSEDIPQWLMDHPHVSYHDAWTRGKNAIFLPTEKLSLVPGMPGCGTFKYAPQRVLTRPGCNCSQWSFPAAMYGTPISHNPNGWRDGFFQSVGRGQEFVMEATPAVMDWVRSLF